MCQDSLIIVIAEGLMCWRLGRWMGDGMASISIVARERRGVERRAEKERRKIIFSGKDRMILGNSQRIPYFYEKH